MKIFVVICDGLDGPLIYGIFSSEDLANSYIDKKWEKRTSEIYSINIQEFVLNQGD